MEHLHHLKISYLVANFLIVRTLKETGELYLECKIHN